MTLKVEWIDAEREPKCEPNPDFPNGIDLDMSGGATKTCAVEVPYPTARCGTYVISCDKCGQRNAVTTAGRVDDPRKITFGCFANVMNPNPPGLTEIIPPDKARTVRTPHPV